MISADEIIAMRATTAALHVDAVTVTRPSTSSTLDPDTGVETPDAGTTVYEGPAMISPINVASNVVNFGEEPITRREYLLRVPAEVDGLEVDDRVLVTASVFDGSLAGRSLRVLDVHRGTLLIDRTALCEDILG